MSDRPVTPPPAGRGTTEQGAAHGWHQVGRDTEPSARPTWSSCRRKFQTNAVTGAWAPVSLREESCPVNGHSGQGRGLHRPGSEGQGLQGCLGAGHPGRGQKS